MVESVPKIKADFDSDVAILCNPEKDCNFTIRKIQNPGGV